MRLGKPLPIAPRPRAGELVISWLLRTAAYYEADAATFVRFLLPSDGTVRSRLNLNLAESDIDRLADAFRLPREQVAHLDLARAWPGLNTDWLSDVGRTVRARGESHLSWCRMCLEEGHLSGGAFFDRETALPLSLCHRHQYWRVDSCQRCVPRQPPEFCRMDGVTEVACGDCHRLLRVPGRPIWPEEWASDDRHMVRKFEILLAFERCLRAALLGYPVRLEGVGRVEAAEFLALVDDLTWALLAPNLSSTSLINRYGCDFLFVQASYKERKWSRTAYRQLGPMARAWVLSAIIAIISSEEISLLFSGRYWARHDRKPGARRLEWLFDNAAVWVQAMLIRQSAHWPARLRERMQALELSFKFDVDEVLDDFHIWQEARARPFLRMCEFEYDRLIDRAWL